MAEKKLVQFEGLFADAGQLDDWGDAKAVVVGGPHDGHVVTIETEKHNCGAYGESVRCDCGDSWQSAMHGCWQHGHQREEGGDGELAEMMTLAYRLIAAESQEMRQLVTETLDERRPVPPS